MVLQEEQCDIEVKAHGYTEYSSKLSCNCQCQISNLLVDSHLKIIATQNRIIPATVARYRVRVNLC
jgi:hypothetical protein